MIDIEIDESKINAAAKSVSFLEDDRNRKTVIEAANEGLASAIRRHFANREKESHRIGWWNLGLGAFPALHGVDYPLERLDRLNPDLDQRATEVFERRLVGRPGVHPRPDLRRSLRGMPVRQARLAHRVAVLAPAASPRSASHRRRLRSATFLDCGEQHREHHGTELRH